MKVVFFGTPDFAVPSLRRLLLSRHEVVGVITQPDRPRGRGHHSSDGPVKNLALSNGRPVLQPERLKDEGFIGRLARFGADIGVVAAYGRILPESVLAVPPVGIVNVHASLLPRYRGAAPIQRAVMAGERETGVSIMRVVRELDAGPVFAARSTGIGGNETSDSVSRRLADLGADLLLEVMDDIEAGHAHEMPQDEGQATYAPRLDKAEGLIDWSAPAEVIHNKVRGLHPWPHAFTFLGHIRYLVLESSASATPEAPRTASDRTPRAGEIVEVTRDAVCIAAGGGTRLSILRIQPAGRRAMGIREFCAGHEWSPGMVFGPE